MLKVKDLLEEAALLYFGQTISDAHKAGTCIKCKKPAIANCYSEAGKKEYKISGLCEKCFDEITIVQSYTDNEEE